MGLTGSSLTHLKLHPLHLHEEPQHPLTSQWSTFTHIFSFISTWRNILCGKDDTQETLMEDLVSQNELGGAEVFDILPDLSTLAYFMVMLMCTTKHYKFKHLQTWL